MLRGGFGHAFRRLCCVPQCKDARCCPISTTCPYKAIFEPSPPAGSDRLSKNQDIPRPFVFRAPQSFQNQFQPGQRFDFDLVLIGRALEFLPYFVLSFRELAAQGLGLNRARCTLQRVDALAWVLNGKGYLWKPSQHVFDAQDQLFRQVVPLDVAGWVQRRCQELIPPPNTMARSPEQSEGVVHLGKGDAAPCAAGGPQSLSGPTQLRIRFLTPTLLKVGDEVVRRPEFHHVFKRLRDRINALFTFFGDGPLQVDFKGLGQRSEAIEATSSRTEWIDRYRTSSKTGQRHEISGFVGEATYCGELAEFLPWLAMGELVHLGKHTAWGNGWMELSGCCAAGPTSPPGAIRL